MWWFLCIVASSSLQRCSEGAAEGFHQPHDITETSKYDPLVILINVKCKPLCINTAEVKTSADEGQKVKASTATCSHCLFLSFFYSEQKINHCSLWTRSIFSPPAALLSPCWRYLAGAQHSRHAVAVPQRELDLDVDSPGSLSRDPHRPQPVVLAGAHHITHLMQRETGVSRHQLVK